MARQHLRELREFWQVEPTLEETLWIIELCKRVVNPVAGERLELIGVPARCGASDEWLWPITIGAAIWYQDLACGWWQGDREGTFKALAFSLAHARDKEILRMCRTRAEAEGLIHAWGMSLTCTRAELEEAVDRVLPETPRPDKDKKAAGYTDWTALVGEIEMVSGIGAEHWLWEVSREETLRAWFRSRQVLAARGMGAGAESPDPLDEAVQDLAAAKQMIIDAHKEAS